jgi:hypothetical protein
LVPFPPAAAKGCRVSIVAAKTSNKGCNHAATLIEAFLFLWLVKKTFSKLRMGWRGSAAGGASALRSSYGSYEMFRFISKYVHAMLSRRLDGIVAATRATKSFQTPEANSFPIIKDTIGRDSLSGRM